MQRKGASIVAGSGAVVCHARLTVVAGGSVIQGSDDLGRSVLSMIDQLEAAGDWSFEAVAAALHELVIDEDPRGVAAVLADDDGEVLLFAFDRATAQGGEAIATGKGRTGWTTEVASGPSVQLRLDNVPFKAAETDIELRAGLVPGAGALLTVSPYVAPAPAPVPTPAPVTSAPSQTIGQPVPPTVTPPPPTGPSTSSALPPNYLPAPPPTEGSKVDASLLPPPPGEWEPGPPVSVADSEVSTAPPPPAGPAVQIPPPPYDEPEPPSGPPVMKPQNSSD